MFDTKILNKEYRNKCRDNILQFFPKEKEVFVYHPNTNTYLVSNLGRVKSGSTGKILKPIKNRNKYDMVNVIFNDGRERRCVFIHRLVCETFLSYFDNSDYIMEVNHMNGNKNDNTLYNLEWMTRQENLQHSRDNKLSKPSGYIKFTSNEVKDMIELRNLGFSYNNIAKAYNGNRTYIAKLIKGEARKHG